MKKFKILMTNLLLILLLFVGCEDTQTNEGGYTIYGDWETVSITKSEYDGENCINQIHSTLPDSTLYLDINAPDAPLIPIISNFYIDLSEDYMINNINNVYSGFGIDTLQVLCDSLSSSGLVEWVNESCQTNFYIFYTVESDDSNQICIRNNCTENSVNFNYCFDYELSSNGEELSLSFIRENEYCYYNQELAHNSVGDWILDPVEKFAECILPSQEQNDCINDSWSNEWGFPFCLELELIRNSND